jgi:hypothetical protein
MKRKIKAVIIIFILGVLLFSGCINEKTENNGNWLESYIPTHSVGNGTNDFWISYPFGNPNSSKTVNHLSWILESLKENCTVFVVHKTGCEACTPQAERIIAFGQKYTNNFKVIDLDINLGGSTEERGYEAYLYDPNGPPGYLALTGVFTLIENNGSVEIAWHSWEGDVKDSEMETWIKDGIYYYNKYSDGWLI